MFPQQLLNPTYLSFPRKDEVSRKERNAGCNLNMTVEHWHLVPRLCEGDKGARAPIQPEDVQLERIKFDQLCKTLAKFPKRALRFKDRRQDLNSQNEDTSIPSPPKDTSEHSSTPQVAHSPSHKDTEEGEVNEIRATPDIQHYDPLLFSGLHGPVSSSKFSCPEAGEGIFQTCGEEVLVSLRV